MAEAITKSNLFSESRNNALDIIKNNVSDPVTTSSEFRKWIYSRMPDIKADDFGGYPFIILRPSEVDVLEDDSSGNGKKKFVEFSIVIEILASDRGYGGNDGKGLSHIDAITDSIVEEFNDITNRQTLYSNGLKYSKPTFGRVETMTQNNELVYRREGSINFSNRMQISS